MLAQLQPGALGHLPSGFPDPVHQSQRTFRSIMQAWARPGQIITIDNDLIPPMPVGVGQAAFILTLADHDTKVWLSETYRAVTDIGAWITFHTGTTITCNAADANFALVDNARTMPPLEAFAKGTLEYPDRSCTILLEVGSLKADDGWSLAGPGINGRTRLFASGVPDCFEAQLTANARLFPMGVDVALFAGASVAALPRTTRIMKEAA